MNLDIYKDIALSQVPRIFSFQDRNEISPTYGCFDRNYWHYRLIDFPNIRWQEGILLSAYLYTHDMEGNRWYANKQVYNWIIAGIRFWEQRQGKGGSFSEVFPFERSFVGASFSTFAVTEAGILTGIEIDREKLDRAANWLLKNDNLHVANQMAGGAAALANIHAITGDSEHKKAATSKVTKLLQLQEEEGYFVEYGGFDYGYLTICLSYIAKFLKRLKHEELEDSAIKAFEYIESRIDDRCLFEFKHTSRGTQYLYPYGFVYFDRVDFLVKHTLALNEGRVLNPVWMDDRFSLPLTIDYFESYLKGNE